MEDLVKDEEYKVSELAKLLDLTPETIRYYESVGIISPRHDDSNRYRYYLSTDFSRLYNAKLLRSLGFALSDIKSFFYEKNNKDQQAAALAKAQELEESVKEIQHQIEVLKVFSEELGDLDRLYVSSDITDSKPFWLVPFREDYSYDTDSASMQRIRSLLEKHSIPRYSYIMKLGMKEDMPGICRYIGYSVSADNEKPADRAILIPSRKAIRFAYRMVAGERFSVSAKKFGMYGRLRDMGILSDSVELYGHTINLSTVDGVTYLSNVGYIPIGGDPLLDWDALKDRF